MLTCKFSCSVCGLKDVEVQVPAREDPDKMTVVEWMDRVVVRHVMRAHLQLSLLCQATHLTELKIPFPKDDPDGWIGKQVDIVPPDGTEVTICRYR